MMKSLEGLYAALVTPFDQDGNVDYSALKHLMRKLQRSGLAGFYVCGSTAE